MPVLSLSFASTSAKRPPLGVVDHYGSRKGVHPFTGSLTTFNVTGCLVYLFGEAMIMPFPFPESGPINTNFISIAQNMSHAQQTLNTYGVESYLFVTAAPHMNLQQPL